MNQIGLSEQAELIESCLVAMMNLCLVALMNQYKKEGFDGVDDNGIYIVFMLQQMDPDLIRSGH